ERFRVVTGTAFAQHDLAWVQAHAPADGAVRVLDATSAYACIGIWGPASRAVLQGLSDHDLSNESFPYLRARDLSVESIPCLAVRVTYVGELGWELYAPAEFGVRRWDVLGEAGGECDRVP